MKQHSLFSDELLILAQADNKDNKTPGISKLFYCRYHGTRWDGLDDWSCDPSTFILMFTKKKKNKVWRCYKCEHWKEEQKITRQKEWEKEKEKVSIYYVRHILATGGNRLRCKMEDYPEELVKAKQAAILLKRATTPIKTCQMHGKLYDQDVIKAGKTDIGTQQYKCRACMKEFHKKHYEFNKEKIKIKQENYREHNKETLKETKRLSFQRHYEKNKSKYQKRYQLYREQNREMVRARERRFKRRAVDLLKNSYVKKLLKGHSKVLKNKDFPPELVELKRASFVLKRAIKEKTKSTINTKEEVPTNE